MQVNIFTARNQLLVVASMFAEAGLDLEQFMAANDKTALKAHLETLKAPASPALTAETPEVAAFITAATAPLAAQVDSLTGQLLVHAAVLKGAGVTLAADATPEDAQKAFDAAVAKAAANQLARRGVAQFAPSEPSADPTKPEKPAAEKLTGLAKVEAAFKAQAVAKIVAQA